MLGWWEWVRMVGGDWVGWGMRVWRFVEGGFSFFSGSFVFLVV